MSFSAAEENFHSGARDGIAAHVYWPGLGTLPASELVLRRLLPRAYAGLDSWGMDATERDRLLRVIEQRCLTGRNGSTWQTSTFHRLFDAGAMDRFDALREVVRRYSVHMHENLPVHEWPVEEALG
jgi:hypothetical protein